MKALVSLALLSLSPPTVAQESQAPAAPAVSQEQLEAWTKEVGAQVAELRGTKFKQEVPVAVSDAATLMAYVAKRQDKLETPASRAADVDVAKLLGVMPADMDYEAEVAKLLEGQVGGFYDPDTKGFYLMDSYTGGLARSILAHELTHALDDQYYDIDGTLAARKDNADAQWAFQAVVEGSGTAIGNAWTAKYGQLSPQEMMEQASMGMDVLKDAIPYLYKPLLGAYLRGLLFLTQSDSLMEMAMGQKEPALATYEHCFENPPLSSEQVLHPSKYWDEAERDDPVPLVWRTEGLPEGWTVLRQQTLGELGWALVLEDPDKRGGIASPLAVMAVRYTGPASEGWGGDRYLLLGKGDARVLFCATVWDTETDAREFETVMKERSEFLRGAVAAVAQVRELVGAGFELSPREGVGVELACWVGSDADEVRALRAAIGVRRASAAGR